MKDIEEIAEKLKKDPNEENWKVLSSALKKGNVFHYRIFFGKGKLNNTQDLKKSYIELYDKKEAKLARIPIFVSKGKKIEGATIYLKGLSILNG